MLRPLPPSVDTIVVEIVSDADSYRLIWKEFENFKEDRGGYPRFRESVFSILKRTYAEYARNNERKRALTGIVTLGVFRHMADRDAPLNSAFERAWVREYPDTSRSRKLLPPYNDDVQWLISHNGDLRRGVDLPTDPTPTQEPAVPTLPTTEVTQENDMNPTTATTFNTNAPAVETKTFIYGTEAKNVKEDEIFNAISALEAQIETLEAIKNKPKALVKKIAGLKADIEALVKLSDERNGE